MDVSHSEGEEEAVHEVNSNSPAAPSPVICLLSQVNPNVDLNCSSATYCNKACGKTINVRNVLRLCVLSRLLGAMSHGNNTAKAGF